MCAKKRGIGRATDLLGMDNSYAASIKANIGFRFSLRGVTRSAITVSIALPVNRTTCLAISGLSLRTPSDLIVRSAGWPAPGLADTRLS